MSDDRPCMPRPERPSFRVIRATTLSDADAWLLADDVEGVLMDGDAEDMADAERVLLQRLGGQRNVESYVACLRAGHEYQAAHPCGGTPMTTIPRDLYLDSRGNARPRPNSASANIDRPFALKCGAKVARCCGRIVWNTVSKGDCVPCAEWFGDVARAELARPREEAGK